MASIGFDLDFGIPANSSAFASIAMDGDEYLSCSRCGHGGCDVRVFGCGCTVHAVRTCVEFYVPFRCRQHFGQTSSDQAISATTSYYLDHVAFVYIDRDALVQLLLVVVRTAFRQR